jgi:LysR family transcriptional regulator, glycine cleavage system transcriptional activator
MRRLPPLNSLRAFEAAARHLSFADAAAELHVTPAAISHQVKALEDHLGVTLFRRLNRAVRLTEQGQACLPGLRDAFDRLADAVERARMPVKGGVLTVSVAPSFAAKWLVPRLDRFRDAYPDIEIRISAGMHLVDFAREDVHIGLRYGSGHYPGLHVELLLHNEVFPLCSPALLRGRHALKRPEDLRHHTLLHDEASVRDESCPDWPMWLRAAGVTGLDATRGPRFDHASLVLDAAAAGRGVALTQGVLAGDDLAAGRLVKPFALTFPVEFAYYVVCPPSLRDDPKVAAFRKWVQEEAKRTASGRARPDQPAPPKQKKDPSPPGMTRGSRPEARAKPRHDKTA